MTSRRNRSRNIQFFRDAPGIRRNALRLFTLLTAPNSLQRSISSFYNDAINQALQGRLTFEEMRLTYPGWGERQLRSRVEWLHTCDLHAIAACHRGLQEEEIHSDFPHISVPTLLLAAEKGGVISDEDLIEIRRLMPMIQTARLAGAGHMLPFDDLDGFVQIVEQFFDHQGVAP